MKPFYTSLTIILLTFFISGCAFTEKLPPLPWQKEEKQAQQTEPSQEEPAAATTATAGQPTSTPVNERKIVSVTDTARAVSPQDEIAPFITALVDGNYDALLEDATWKSYISRRYKSPLAFKKFWDEVSQKVLEETEAAAIELFEQPPNIAESLIGREAAVDATFADWLVITFEMKKEGSAWAVQSVTWQRTGKAQQWLENNTLLKEKLLPLKNSYNQIVQWSSWAFNDAESKELPKYYRDIAALETSLANLDATPAFAGLKQDWIKSLSTLKLAVAAKMNQLDPEELISETTKLVNQIDQAENVKEPLGEKLNDADDVDEDLAEDILNNAQQILQQKLNELRTAAYPDTSLRSNWEDLNGEFGTSWQQFTETYSGNLSTQ